MKEINRWFEENKRDFPWRRERSPYRVWISEMMLQQTRASVVIPYFLRWMELFPNVKALYIAPLEEIIKAWEGLGYYSRARNIHAAAKKIIEEWGGEIPHSREALLSLPGFGPYTTGAVLSFGFQKRAAAVDGNVLRVLSRYFLIEEEISRSSVRKRIEELAESILDREQPWITAEALIELGATLCGSTPRCEDCPLKKGCLGFQTGKAASLPIKQGEVETTILHRNVFIVEHGREILLRKGEKGKIMADLYEFPYVEKGDEKDVRSEVYALTGETPQWVKKLGQKSHTFTRFKAILYPYWVQIKFRALAEGMQWHPIEKLCELPFSSGHRKIREEILSLLPQKKSPA